jgi:hypothetical protein
MTGWNDGRLYIDTEGVDEYIIDRFKTPRLRSSQAFRTISSFVPALLISYHGAIIQKLLHLRHSFSDDIQGGY